MCTAHLVHYLTICTHRKQDTRKCPTCPHRVTIVSVLLYSVHTCIIFTIPVLCVSAMVFLHVHVAMHVCAEQLQSPTDCRPYTMYLNSHWGRVARDCSVTRGYNLHLNRGALLSRQRSGHGESKLKFSVIVTQAHSSSDNKGTLQVACHMCRSMFTHIYMSM